MTYHLEAIGVGVEIGAEGDDDAGLDHLAHGWALQPEYVGRRGQDDGHAARARHRTHALVRHLLQVRDGLGADRSAHLKRRRP